MSSFPSMASSLYHIGDELADYDAGQPDTSLGHLLSVLSNSVDAQNAVWFAGVRMPEAGPGDPFNGWRPKGRYLLLPFQGQKQMEQLIEARIEAGEVDPTTVRNISFSGRLRANRLCDLVEKDWFESDFYHQMYRQFDLSDAIWAGCPVNQDTEVYIGLYRHIGQPAFSDQDRTTVEDGLRGLKWFHRQQLLSRGLLLADAPLTPMERQVLTGLLDGSAEKVIAASLEQSVHTTHDHVKSIYRKFGVSNRSALMALWLGRN